MDAKIHYVFDQLVPVLADRVSLKSADREAHGRDESWHAVALPDLVAYPESTEEVSHIVQVCSATGTPLVPFGAGTSLEGQLAAIHGGLSLDLSRMSRVLEVHQEDLDCRVQAGATRKALNAHLKDLGLFFPVDPGADATLGGMAATRASGTNAVRYGTMRENVLSLTVVLADGTIVRTGGRARKSSAGYDLTRLLVGSEGTLGVITEVGLRVYGIPEAMAVGMVSFPTVAQAVDTVIATIQLGMPVARIEFLDALQMHACNRYSKLSLPEEPTLFLEFHGGPASVAEQLGQFGALSEEFGGGEFVSAVETEARNRLWAARHGALYAARALAPGKQAMITDVCVPISRLSETILATQADIAAAGILAPIAGHVGDGNFHLIMMFDPSDPAELASVRALHDRMVERAIDAGGTCTGEHGVGQGKMRFMRREHGEGVDLMRVLKSALDPANILNPGKVLPA